VYHFDSERNAADIVCLIRDDSVPRSCHPAGDRSDGGKPSNSRRVPESYSSPLPSSSYPLISLSRVPLYSRAHDLAESMHSCCHSVALVQYALSSTYRRTVGLSKQTVARRAPRASGPSSCHVAFSTFNQILPVATTRPIRSHFALVMPLQLACSTVAVYPVPVFLAAGPHFTVCPVPYSFN
jgi:hypothetical protein